jgi:uncharacterized protein (TIGR03066 family)
MRIATALFLCASLGLISGARTIGDGEKDIRGKLLGVWEMMRDGQPRGITMEFRDDGKVRMTTVIGGRDIKVAGTYEIKGMTIYIKKLIGDEEIKESLKIKRLTDSDLEVVGEGGKTHEFAKEKKCN